MDRQQHARLDELMRDPYPLYERARRAVGLTYVPEMRAWLVARDADVREVLRRPDVFSSANAVRGDVVPSPAALAVLAASGAGDGGRTRVVVTSDGPAHQRLRAPITRGLGAARVAAAVAYAEGRAEELVEAFAGEGRAELMGAYALRLPGQVVGYVLGFDPADVPLVVRGGQSTMQLLFRPLGEEEQVAAARDIVALRRLLDGYVRDRHAEPRDDLCSEIVGSLVPEDGEEGAAVGETGVLTLAQRAELVSHLNNFLLAGHLTTTALIGTTFLHLLRHPDQWRLVCEEPERIPAAIEETARYDTALQGFRRVTTRAVTFAGTELPAGAELLVGFGAAGRDDARHPRPDVFDITRRTAARHVAFGLGAHACPGAQLAREQVRLTLELFARRFPGLRLDGDRPPVTMRPTLIHRAPEALHVRW
ncbi:cytochrome P450 [Streptomyces sp. NPDC059063]|uniref:cytochrome P450 n=1 Tax=unclassified Streptomyces TaxID=2593676 RepID=UPI0036AFE5D2